MQSSIYKHFGMPVVSSHEQNTRNVWRPHSTDSSSSKRRVQRFFSPKDHIVRVRHADHLFSYRSTSVCQSSLRPMSPDFSGAVDSSFQFISPVRISQHHQNRKATFYIESPHNIDRPTTSLSRRLTIESPQFFQPIGHTVQSYQLMNKSYDHSPRNASLRSLATYMSSPESLSKAEEKVMTLWRKPRWQS